MCSTRSLLLCDKVSISFRCYKWNRALYKNEKKVIEGMIF